MGNVAQILANSWNAQGGGAEDLIDIEELGDAPLHDGGVQHAAPAGP